jgi:glutamine synthetase
MSAAKVSKLMKDNGIKFVDLRFTDTRGKEQHVTLPSGEINAGFFRDGKMFDGSSIAGWKGINESDMVLMPDTKTAVVDPFTDEPTINLRCDILEPTTMKGYERDPRSIANRAEAYLKSTGIADTAYFGPENEFFVFDDVRWGADMSGAFYKVDSEEAEWNSERVYEDGNTMCLALDEMGCPTEVHHHEVATAGQCEIGTVFNTLVRKADETQILKYVVQNVAHSYGKTATFMPKPLVGDNGNGMHVHQSLAKAGKNLFSGKKYGGLSDLALYYIGGIIKHARALNAFTNASTNSYKRLVPGFEAPVMLAYSARNRSASIRIPYVANPKGRRIEIRFPDSTANPYLAFSAMLMAGLDGIQNKIHPGDAMDKDLYDLPAEEEAKIPQVCYAFDQALKALEKDHKFLTAGGVFSNDMIDGFIKLKMEEVTQLRMTTHPLEFDMYYSL